MHAGFAWACRCCPYPPPLPRGAVVVFDRRAILLIATTFNCDISRWVGSHVTALLCMLQFANLQQQLSTMLWPSKAALVSTCCKSDAQAVLKDLWLDYLAT